LLDKLLVELVAELIVNSLRYSPQALAKGLII
jgi:hypothetical protein